MQSRAGNGNDKDSRNFDGAGVRGGQSGPDLIRTRKEITQLAIWRRCRGCTFDNCHTPTTEKREHVKDPRTPKPSASECSEPTEREEFSNTAFYVAGFWVFRFGLAPPIEMEF